LDFAVLTGFCDPVLSGDLAIASQYGQSRPPMEGFRDRAAETGWTSELHKKTSHACIGAGKFFLGEIYYANP
jgi:hypothetical protein